MSDSVMETLVGLEKQAENAPESMRQTGVVFLTIAIAAATCRRRGDHRAADYLMGLIAALAARALDVIDPEGLVGLSMQPTAWQEFTPGTPGTATSAPRAAGEHRAAIGSRRGIPVDAGQGLAYSPSSAFGPPSCG